jgi:hypothetical protein
MSEPKLTWPDIWLQIRDQHPSKTERERAVLAAQWAKHDRDACQALCNFLVDLLSPEQLVRLDKADDREFNRILDVIMSDNLDVQNQ